MKKICCAVLFLVSCRSHWNVLSPVDAGFTIEVPGSPKCDSWEKKTATTRWTASGCTIAVEPRFIGRGFPVTYDVRWYDIPPELDGRDITELVRAVQGPAAESRSPMLTRMLREAQERLKEYDIQKTIHAETLGGIAGIQYDSVPSGSQPEFVSRERLCVNGHRLYWVSMYGVTNHARERSWAQMVASFQFVERSG